MKLNKENNFIHAKLNKRSQEIVLQLILRLLLNIGKWDSFLKTKFSNINFFKKNLNVETIWA